MNGLEAVVSLIRSRLDDWIEYVHMHNALPDDRSTYGIKAKQEIEEELRAYVAMDHEALMVQADAVLERFIGVGNLVKLSRDELNVLALDLIRHDLTIKLAAIEYTTRQSLLRHPNATSL